MKIAQRTAYMLIGGISVLLVSGISMASLGDAGTQTDPLVTKSYVEKRLTEIEKKVTDAATAQTTQQVNSAKSQLEALIKASASTGGSTGASEFSLIQVKTGDVIIMGENAQFVMRAGLATAIGGQGGGLSDLTAGKDLKNGESLETNHLVLIPKNDGRGIKMGYDGWLMIKGSYQITK